LAQTFKPPATQRVYDVCVIGPRLGGAAAGALLARRGYRVLHVDHEPSGDTYEDGGYLLPTAPLLLPAPRLLPAADSVLAELGLTTDVARHLEPLAPDLQVLLPRHRVDLPRDPGARLAELRREWPADAARLDAALAELQRLFEAATPFLATFPPLPPAGLRERWALARARRLAPANPQGTAAFAEPAAFRGMGSHPLAAALRSLHDFLGHLDGEPSPLGLARLLGAALRGLHRLPGGPGALREMMRRKIAESRGELLGGDPAPAVAEALELDGRRVVAVRLAGSKDTYVARAFVLGADASLLRALLPRGAVSRLGGHLERAQPSRLLLVVNLVVKAAAIPPGLGEAALCLQGEVDGARAGAILIQVQPARRASRKGPAEPVADERVVILAGFVPASAAAGGGDGLAGMAGRIRAAASDPLPFLERHLVLESIPALAGPPEARASRLLVHPQYQLRATPALGVAGIPAPTPLRNLVSAGREVVPGLGLEGEFHAGLQAARLVGALLGKKELLK
jgi:hypothetical protein